MRAAEYFVPGDYGDARFEEMLNGRWTPGPKSGTTCGYLPGAGLFLAGARDDRLVNYDDPDGATAYKDAANISKIVQGARAVGAWVDDAPGREPKRGDIAFLSNGPSITEHVEIVRDPAEWSAWAAGQTNDRGEQAARVVTRPIDDRRSQGGPRLLGAPVPIGGGEKRKLQGWVDLDLVPWDAEPTGPAAPEIETRSPWLFVAGTIGAAAGAAALFAALRPPPPPPRRI